MNLLQHAEETRGSPKTISSFLLPLERLQDGTVPPFNPAAVLGSHTGLGGRFDPKVAGGLTFLLQNLKWFRFIDVQLCGNDMNCKYLTC